MPDLRARALRLLSRRDYGRRELGQKLTPYASDPDEVEALLDDLEARHLLSDLRFASQRVAARAPRFGNQRLAKELRGRGVDEDCVRLVLAENADEEGRCRAVWQKKYGVLPEDAKDYARQDRFLRYRGFSPEVVRRVLRGGTE